MEIILKNDASFDFNPLVCGDLSSCWKKGVLHLAQIEDMDILHERRYQWCNG